MSASKTTNNGAEIACGLSVCVSGATPSTNTVAVSSSNRQPAMPERRADHRAMASAASTSAAARIASAIVPPRR